MGALSTEGLHAARVCAETGLSILPLLFVAVGFAAFLAGIVLALHASLLHVTVTVASAVEDEPVSYEAAPPLGPHRPYGSSR